MSDKPRDNTFRYAFNAGEVANILSRQLDSAAKILNETYRLYEDQAQQRGLVHIMLSRVATITEDAFVRLTDFAAAENPSDNGKVGDQ